MEQGWIYVLVNSSTPGMAKVGRTTRAPAERAAELSAATGVPTPFVVAFDQCFADCAEAERLLHAELDRRGLRVAANREFFRGTPSDIIRVIIEMADHHFFAAPAAPDLSAERLLKAGDNALLGAGDMLQDTGEALRCYKLAASRGSLIAYERVGHIYTQLYIDARERAGRRRALSALKEGVRRGNYYCYGELAVAFAVDRHIANFRKSWDLFFARRADSRLDELERLPGRFIAACSRYIAQTLELGEIPEHRTELAAVADDILALLLAELDAVHDRQPERSRITTVMRWAYESLLPMETIVPKPSRRFIRPPIWRVQAGSAPG